MTIKYETWVGKLSRYAVYIPVIIYALTMILPFYWMLIGAFKSVPELRKEPPTFMVEDPTTTAFHDPDVEDEAGNRRTSHVDGLFQRFDNGQMHLKIPMTDETIVLPGYVRYYLHSLGVSLGIVFGVLTIASLTSYVLAKHQFPGRNIFFVFFLTAMMIPWQVTLIPSYLLMLDLGWDNTFWALIIPALPKAYAVFFLRQYMLSIPSEMLEAAKVDGAGELRIWWRIVVPLSRPALVAMGILLFLEAWNNLMWPVIILRDADKYTLPIAISTLSNSAATGPLNGSVLLAATLLMSVPLLFVFAIFQRQFVAGITMGGVKG